MTKKIEKENIKNIYSDALFWATAPLSKKKPYHLTRVHESVLRKLIHYDKKNPKISFSSEWIAKHTFLDITQIEKSIPHLNGKGYIRCTYLKSKGKNKEVVKRRIINIEWDFIEEILAEVPKLQKMENLEIEELEPEDEDEDEERNSLIPPSTVPNNDNLDNIPPSASEKDLLQQSNQLIRIQLDEIVDIEQVMIYLGFDMKDTNSMLSSLGNKEVPFKEIVLRINYFARQQQKYTDYNNIKITDDIKEKLQKMIIKKPIQLPNY